MANKFKTFLYAFCGKRKVQPTYAYEDEGTGFYCEVRVPGFDFIGCGEARSKKDAQGLAAQTFCQFLVRGNLMDEASLPATITEGETQLPLHPVQGQPSENPVPSSTSQDSTTPLLSLLPVARQPEVPHSHPPVVVQPGPSQADNPVASSQSYGVSTKVSSTSEGREQFNKQGVKRKFDEMQNEDGNYSLETAKSRLHLFLQQTRQPHDMQIRPVGPNHNRSFVAEMTIFVPKFHKTIYAQEHSGTKKSVGNVLALNLVRQLYQMGAIDASRPPGKKKLTLQVEPREVNIPTDVQDTLRKLLPELNISPVTMSEEMNEPISVLLPLPQSTSSHGNLTDTPGVVEWQPPHIDWHPWAGRSAYDVGGAYSSLDPEARAKQISNDLYVDLSRRKGDDLDLQKSLKARQLLPIATKAAEIVSMVHDRSVVVLCGATGCGKTTQVPQFILDSMIANGTGAHCNVIVTQPRRISAVSVAERVGQERCEELGRTVGYSVRFESVLPRHYASILFCTSGVLLRRLESGLVGISHIIVDEVHERDLNSDFLLVVLRDMVRAYPSLRVVLMSATINTTLFSEYFDNAPVLEVHGETFPVREYFLEDAIQMVHFLPPPPNTKRRDYSQEDDEALENLNMVCDTVEYSLATQHALSQLNEKDISFELIAALLGYFKTLGVPGAVLVFLPGWNTIFALLRQLTAHPVYGSSQYCVLPCHSQVPREEQRRVFAPVPPGVTKVILATNIAESSITIDDVVYVIDGAKARIKTFTSHNNMIQYSTVWASHTNLKQRCGRAGRVREGYCFHLCSRARYEKLPLHITPEIQRTPLHELALSIKLLGLRDVTVFLAKAIEAPPPKSVTEALVLLREMEALDVNDELTPLGTILARLPVEPRLGRMILLGTIFGVGDALCTIAACSSFQEPFIVPPGMKKLPYSHKRFSGHRASDHLAILNAFYQWENVRADGEAAEVAFCETNHLAHHPLRMAAEARNQLKQILTCAGCPEECFAPFPIRVTGDDPKASLVVALLCVGLYPNVCYHVDKRRLLTSDGKAALIHKSSVNNITKDPSFPLPYFIFEEKLKTKAVSAKSTTMVEPIHLLLFGSSSVICHADNLIKLDEWLPLNISGESAALIGGLRQAVDNMLLNMTASPQLLTQHSSSDDTIIQVIESLVSCKATTPPALSPAPADRHPSPVQGSYGGRGRSSFPAYGGRGRSSSPTYGGRGRSSFPASGGRGTGPYGGRARSSFPTYGGRGRGSFPTYRGRGQRSYFPRGPPHFHDGFQGPRFRGQSSPRPPFRGYN